MSKGDRKRAAIVAQQAAREQAEREARGATGQQPNARRRRSNWGGMSGMQQPRRGRPPKAVENP